MWTHDTRKMKGKDKLLPAEGCKEEHSQACSTFLGLVPIFSISWLEKTLPDFSLHNLYSVLLKNEVTSSATTVSK